MAYFSAQSEFRHGEPTRVGLLLCNLGTPAAASTGAVRKYLAEFLADRRVVELPRWLWMPLLHGVILRIRPRRSAHAYQSIWTESGSPLLAISMKQAAGVQRLLEQTLAAPVVAELGMRYGDPSIGSALRKLREQNVRKLVVLPLYPQYTAATSGAAFDAVSAELRRWRWVPELRFINEYFDDPRYIEALADSVRRHWAAHGRGAHLLMSFHGIPQDYFLAGDPYHCRCHATARMLADALDLSESEWGLSFQSRVGPKQWLQPYTDKTIAELGASGLEKLDVICPGFAADCLETIEEIAIQNRNIFEQAGGGTLDYIPALNDDDEHLRCLVGIAVDNMGGWAEATPDWDPGQERAAREDAHRRYLEKKSA